MILTDSDHRGFVPPSTISLQGMRPPPPPHTGDLTPGPTTRSPATRPVSRNFANIFREILETSFEKFRKHLSRNFRNIFRKNYEKISKTSFEKFMGKIPARPVSKNFANIFRKISQTSFEKFRKHLSKNFANIF